MRANLRVSGLVQYDVCYPHEFSCATEMQVDLPHEEATTRGIENLLGGFRKKGVKFWSENGQLHFKAPKGLLTGEEIESLKASRDQILAILDEATTVPATAETGENPSHSNKAPLTYSQLSHWNWFQLDRKRGIRHVASVTRIHGQLEIDTLRSSVAELVRHHSALRTRVSVCDGTPMQEILNSSDLDLAVHNLTTSPVDTVEEEITRRFRQLVLEPLDVSVGPLLKVELLRIRDDESVLLVAMEHLISDAFSLNIFQRDLFNAYKQALSGQPVSLPTVHISFADHAIRQRMAQESWIQKHSGYWRGRLAGYLSTRFPTDSVGSALGLTGWRQVSFTISDATRSELIRWSRSRGTTLAMSVFTAYVGLVLRWCEASDVVLQFQIDGRNDSKTANTIGYFASTLYLRVDLHDDDDFIDLMDRVTLEYCNAYEHADSGYMKTEVPRPDFCRTSTFNWIPQPYKATLADGRSESVLTTAPLMVESPALSLFELDRDPITQLFDGTEGISGRIYFDAHRVSPRTMESFTNNLLIFLRKLLRQPDERVKSIRLSHNHV